jgi:hypothetical protein
MLKTIELSYKKTPFFPEVFSVFEKILNSDYLTISQLNLASIKLVCEYLEINTNIELSSSLYNNQHLSGQERILDICTREGANQYINPIGGIEIYNKVLFNDSRVRINFLKTHKIEYVHSAPEFVPWLSILDVVMNNGKEKTSIFLNNYSLV